MKTLGILTTVLFSIFFSSQVFSADFTISLQSSEKKMYVYRKSDNTKLGEYFSNGGNHAIKLSNGKIQLIGRVFITYESFDCTGEPYSQTANYAIGAYTQNGSSFYEVIGPVLASAPMNSRRNESGVCQQLSSTFNVIKVAPYNGTDLIDFTGVNGYFDANFFTNKLE